MNVGNCSATKDGNCPAMFVDILDLDSELTSDGTGVCVTVVVGVVHDPTFQELFVILD
tara:strand:- start:1635 stop:1808 length:174 start_codon:yes stop_codon:yes gene_type:complete